MTTFARGVSAPKRGVGTFTHFGRSAIDQQAIAGVPREMRSAITADAAERQAIQREHRWVNAAAMAGIRMVPRG